MISNSMFAVKLPTQTDFHYNMYFNVPPWYMFLSQLPPCPNRFRSDLHTNYIRWVIIFDLVTHTAGIYTPSIHIKIQFVLSVAALKCKHSSHFTTCHLLWNQLKINTSFHPQNQKTWLTACRLIYFISISRACVLPTRETLHSHFLVNGAKIICTDHLHADLTFI